MTNTYKNKYCYWCGKSCIDNGIDIKQCLKSSIINETRWMRSDTHTINGLSAYKLGTEASNSLVEITIGNSNSTPTCYYMTKVYKRDMSGNETLIAEGAVVSYNYGANSTTTLSNTLNIPETNLEDTDCIVVKIYANLNINPPTTLRATFVSEVLNTNKLPVSTVTIYYRVRRTKAYIGGEYLYGFYYRFGTSTDNSRIENFNYQQEISVSLCSFCIKFPTVGVMYDWMGIVANYALSNKSVILNKIVYNEETGKYDVYFTYYDNDLARQGWVA